MRKIFLLKNKKETQKGAAMLVSVIFFIFISLAIVGGLTSPVIQQYKIVSANTNSVEAYYLAESGVEDVYYRILNNQPINTSENLDLGNNSTTTMVTNLGSDQKKIESLGDAEGHQRKSSILISTGAGASFNYGVQVGEGGLYFNDGTLNGNVYSNGPIYGDSSSAINGTAISANSPDFSADQESGSGNPTANVNFGNNNLTQDIAQSFQISKAGPLTKIVFYIKKIGTPNDAVVKIYSNNNGNPGTLLASSTLSQSLLTTSYGWIEVAFSSPANLNLNTTYWFVIDASTSTSKYYTLGAGENIYNNGLAKIGRLGTSWNSTSPATLDYFFKIYLEGSGGLIMGTSGQWNKIPISGNAQAHNVTYVSAGGNIYCQTGTLNNKLCDTSQPDPIYIPFPVSEANLDLWKDEAFAGGVYNGNYSVGWAGATLGPKKVVGNLSVAGGGTLTVTGPLWITGNLTLAGGGKIKLAASYGQNDGVIIVDGTISVSGGGNATGSGTAGSYLMLVSLNSSEDAISVQGGAGAMVAYAPYGTITLSGGASLKEATGYKIVLDGGSTLTYETGLANMNFSTGPSGSWSLDSWKETE